MLHAPLGLNRAAIPFVIVFYLLLPWRAYSQPTETIGYQGFLTDSSGTPINATANLSFRIYDALIGGTELWTETQNGVPVTDGVFSVQLGSVTSFRSSNLGFDQPYFLGIQVNADPEMSPRLTLGSVPFALRAGKGIANVAVTCPAGSIQDAVDNAPAGGRIIVTISGVCEESVAFRRSNVTFTAANPPATAVTAGGTPADGIRGNTDSSAAIHVKGGRGIMIENIVLESLAGGSDRAGLLVTENGAAKTDNVLVRSSYAGVYANFEGFVNVTNSQISGNTNYGILLTNGGSARMEGSTIIHNVSRTPDGDEAAIGMFRGNNMLFHGNNTVQNAGDDGIFDASNPDAASNDDNGISLWPFHGVSVRQQPSGHTVFIGDIEAGNNVIISLRDPQVVGRIDIANSTFMDLRTSTTSDLELSARSVSVRGGSQLSFGRDNVDLEVSGEVGIFDNSRVGLFRDSITASFGSIRTFRNGTIELKGTVTVSGDVDINERSEISRFSQLNTLTMASLTLNNGSVTNLRGNVVITGNMNGFGNSRFNLFDSDSTSTSDKTVVTVGGDVQINGNSWLQINNTARLEADHISFNNGTEVTVDGAFASPPGCGDPGPPCTVDNFSELRANGVRGANFGQNSRLNINNGGVVTAQNMNAGPFVTLNLNNGSDLAIGTPVPGVTTPGSINIFNLNQVFWNDDAFVIGNINAGAFTLINRGGAGGGLQGNINMSGGIAPGVLNFFSDFTIDGSIDCGGGGIDPGTVNRNGFTIIASGGFINCL